MSFAVMTGPLEMDNFRLEPPEMVFDNPFEGKTFQAKLVIQNIGKSSGFIRILEPSASGVVMKSLKRGTTVPPGLKIIRTVRYRVNMATLIDYCIIPIYINDTLLDYKIFVRAIPIALVVEPSFIDFGVVDAGYSTSKCSCVLKNTGPKPEAYKIDLGDNALNLCVDPMKGVVMNDKSVQIHVEVSLFQKGTYCSEFWIIAKNPICVKIFLKVVTPRIETITDEGTPTFTLVHFTKTYIGTKLTKAILLRNKSQGSSMFCVTGVVDGESKTVHNLSDLPGDFKHYDGYPLSGRLHANDVRPFIFTFAPKHLTSIEHSPLLVTIKIHKLAWKDISNFSNHSIYSKRESASAVFSGFSSTTPRGSGGEGFELEDSFDEDNEERYDSRPLEEDGENCVRIMLYGVAEKASISFRPKEFEFIEVEIEKTITRTLTITNDSHNLPIVFRYVKTGSIDIKPRMATLQATEKIEVLVLITPHLGLQVGNSINFELLYWNRPRLTNDFVKVGSCKVPVHITTCRQKKDELRKSVEFKKPFIKPNIMAMKRLIENHAIPALTIDTNTIMRPWKDERLVMTPYATIPRLKNTYDSSQELQKKLFNDTIFIKYIKEMYEKHKKQELPIDFEEYEVNDKPLNCYTKRPVSVKLRNEPNFIPLTPHQLYNITLHPRHTILESVANKSNFTNKIRVQNDNDVSIRVYLSPHKPLSFQFPHGARFVVKGNSELVIEYVCISGSVGTQYLLLDIVVNESHVFETTITSHVKPTSLNFSFTQATFNSKKSTYKYLELTNSMNTKIDFNWDYTANFSVYPREGFVPPKKTITCKISYEIGNCPNMFYVLGVCIDFKKFKSINLKMERTKIPLVYNDKVSFGTFGVNENANEHAVKISNPTKQMFSFEVLPIELDGLTVTPTNGTFYPNGKIFFRFRVIRTEPGEFNTRVLINIANGTKFAKIDVDGCAVFPIINSSPACLRFLKISASSYDVKCFKIENCSDVKARIEFDIDFFPEIKYSEYTNSPFLKKGDYILVGPKDTKTIVAHFYPQYAQANSFYLPVLVNSLPRTITSKTSNTKLYTKVLSHKLITNAWCYSFQYFPHYNVNNNSKTLIKLTALKGPVKFLIRIDDLKPPFSLDHIEGGICTIYDKSIVCALSSDGEMVIFEAKFKPSGPGEFRIKLPVFVKDDFDDSPHNTITLTGTYPQPTISFHSNAIYVGFLPLNFPVARTFKGKMKYHSPDCDMGGSCRSDNVEIESIQKGDGIERIIIIRMIYFSKTIHVLDESIQFKCNCGCQQNIRVVGGSTNSLFTNHACLKYFTLSNRGHEGLFDPNFTFTSRRLSSCSKITLDSGGAEQRKPNIYPTTLPFFPPKDHILHDYMNDVVSAIEQWLFDQGFHGSTYYKIPDTIAEIEVTYPSKVKSKNERFGKLSSPFYHLLLYICGSQFKRYTSTEFDEKVPLVPRVIQLYKNILEILTVLGAFLPHVTPEYLLSYRLYEEYKGAEKLNYEPFYSISKQCWLDVILETYSIFMYNKSPIPVLKKKSLMFRSSSSFECIDVSSVNNFKYNDHDAKLLIWYSGIWNNMKRRLMSSEFGNEPCQELLDRKTLDYEDFADGLAFAAATMLACPYLTDNYSSLYVPPRRKQECYHNAYLNIKAWEFVQSGLHFSPEDLISFNTIRTAIVCDYLYVFLKTLKVTETITFKCNLTKTSDEVINIINDNNHTIRYKAIFFSNADQTFSLDEENIVIKPGETYTLTIHFNARFAKKQIATIALCGEISGNKWTQSKVYMLEGIPLLKEPLGVYEIKSMIYEIMPLHLKILTPYQKSANYEIFVARSLPEDLEELELVPYQFLFKNKLLYRATFSEEFCTSNDEGEILILGWTLGISLIPKNAWLFFKNTELGDFFILCTLRAAPSKKFAEMQRELPQTFSLFTCNCDKQVPDWKNQRCPRNVVFKIPFSNDIMWKSLLVYYTTKLYTNVEDSALWDRYGDDEIGLNIFKRIIQDNKQAASEEMSYMFSTNVKYSVSTDDKTIVVQPTVILEDLIDSNSTADIRMHINSQPDTINLSLMSIDRREQRFYKFIIEYTKNKI